MPCSILANLFDLTPSPLDFELSVVGEMEEDRAGSSTGGEGREREGRGDLKGFGGDATRSAVEVEESLILGLIGSGRTRGRTSSIAGG